MLQINTGSIWIGQKVMERISEENQANQRRNFLVKLTLDKVSSTFAPFSQTYKLKITLFFQPRLQRVRWYSMVATPFLTFYIAGLIFSAELLYLIKFVLLGCLYATAHTIGKAMFDDHLMTLLPLSVYMATKLWFYVTWLGYIAPTVSTLTTILFLASSGLLWYCFLSAWRGDPGVIQPTQEQRFRVSDHSCANPII